MYTPFASNPYPYTGYFGAASPAITTSPFASSFAGGYPYHHFAAPYTTPYTFGQPTFTGVEPSSFVFPGVTDFGIAPSAINAEAAQFSALQPAAQQGGKIVLAGSAKAYPEARDKAVERVSKLQEESRKEPGCIAYHWTQSLDDPDEFIIYEHWESEELLVKHLESEQVKEFKEVVPDLFIEDPKVQKTSIFGFEDI
eukprot:TRINITY_DN1637_c0_g1_i1.p1 TRINITY_DN1637_c0_g1~~TRINITY_DN1637_c0_g1_i1.p1  ORF type:complete len:197 (-),score=40.28 TRINITY_DN1637_c0_g1_i1:43-633(-)